MKAVSGYRGLFPLSAGIAANVFVFASFLSIGFAPALGTGGNRQIARFLFVACAFFSAAFTLSYAAFAAAHHARRNRRVTALLSLFGGTRKTAARRLAASFAATSGAAGLAGLLSAFVLSRYISLLLGFLSGARAPFPARWDASIGAAGFGLIAAAIAVGVAVEETVLRRSTPADLFSDRAGAERGARGLGRFIIGLSLIAGGYAGAAQPSATLALVLALPVLASVSVGTLLLFSLAPDVIDKFGLTLSPKRAPFSLALARLRRELRADRRTFAAAALYTAVAVTASGALITLATNEKLQIDRSRPNGLEIAHSDRALVKAHAVRIDAALAADGKTRVSRIVEAIPLRMAFAHSGKELDVRALPLSAWKALMLDTGRPDETNREDGAILCSGYFRTIPGAAGARIRLESGGSGVSGTLRIMKESYVVASDTYLRQVTVRDEDWEALAAGNPRAEKLSVAVWNAQDENAFRIEDPAFRRAIAEAEKAGLHPMLRIDSLDEYRRNAGVSIFIALLLFGAFISVPLAALAFRLREGLESDAGNISTLSVIGMPRGDIERSIAGKAAASFALPALVGELHALFALRMMSVLTGFSTLPAAVAITILSAAVFSIAALVFAARHLEKLRSR